ncbi:putative G-protein coupled receptor 141 [Pelodiscus sinensis]|uniref:G-protein coupled receptors family 1 profile domain-containing protein n=1 Tax=Pelodiscus sinensis TaxID=13735 RepID=K7F1Y5_PELSI
MFNTSSAPQDIASNRTLPHNLERLHLILIALYSISLGGGIAGIIVMSRLLFQRKIQSVMTIIIKNLMVVHSILLFSLPFRISYYISSEWKFGWFTCKMFSGMIYVHMYITFIFYVAIIIIRLLRLEFQRWRTTTWIAAVWFVGTVIIFPIFLSHYGTSKNYNHSKCFQFHRGMKEQGMVIANYCLISIMVTTVSVLSIIQLAVIFQLAMKYWPDMNLHVEFRAQMKSFFFILVILVCFVPHHVFRIYYIQKFHPEDDNNLTLYNEIFLAFTALCCLDMLCFIAGIAH